MSYNKTVNDFQFRMPRWISCSMGWSILVFTSWKVINWKIFSVDCLWRLAPLSTIFQLHVYRGGTFYCLSTHRKPPTCRKLLTSFFTYSCIEYTSPWTRFELTTLVVIIISDTINRIKTFFSFFSGIPIRRYTITWWYMDLRPSNISYSWITLFVKNLLYHRLPLPQRSISGWV